MNTNTTDLTQYEFAQHIADMLNKTIKTASFKSKGKGTFHIYIVNKSLNDPDDEFLRTGDTIEDDFDEFVYDWNIKNIDYHVSSGITNSFKRGDDDILQFSIMVSRNHQLPEFKNPYNKDMDTKVVCTVLDYSPVPEKVSTKSMRSLWDDAIYRTQVKQTQ